MSFLGVLFFRVLIRTFFLPLAVCKYDLAAELGIKRSEMLILSRIFYSLNRVGVLSVVAGYKGN